MAPHTWSHLGDTVSDATHHMYYRGQRIKEAYYRGEKIWGEEIDDLIITLTGNRNSVLSVVILGDNLEYSLDGGERMSYEYSTVKLDAYWDVEETRLYLRKASIIEVTIPDNELGEGVNGEHIVRLYGTNVRYFRMNKGSSSLRASLSGVLTPFGKTASGLETCASMFLGCIKLMTVPDGLFANIAESISFYRCFYGCTSLSSVSSNLFENQQKARRLGGLFDNCTSLTTIPAGLFDSFQNVFTAERCFNNCTSLTTIPAGLFRKCQNLTNLTGCFGYCKSLKTVPSDIMPISDNNITVTDMFVWSGLETIPHGLFDSVPNITSFNETFSSCESLQIISDELFIKQTHVTSFNGCFRNCTSLTNIPPGLFMGNEKINFSECFIGCAALEKIPVGLFDSVPNANNFYWCFGSCTSLTTVPFRLFNALNIPDGPYNYNTAVRFDLCFANCKAITTRVPEIWIGNKNIYAKRCYRGCVKAANYSDIPDTMK